MIGGPGAPVAPPNVPAMTPTPAFARWLKARFTRQPLASSITRIKAATLISSRNSSAPIRVRRNIPAGNPTSAPATRMKTSLTRPSLTALGTRGKTPKISKIIMAVRTQTGGIASDASGT